MKFEPWNRFLTAMILIMAVASARGVTASPPSGIPVEQFVAKRCAECHGPGGQGANPMFPKLAGQRPDYLYRELLKFRSGARRGTLMQVYLGNLEDREIAVLARYLSRQRRLPAPGDGELAETSVRLLYAEGSTARGLPACATCHNRPIGQAFHSSNATSAPRLTGQHAAYIEDQLFRFVNGTRLPGQTPEHPFADRLDDEEIRSLSRYLSYVE